LFLAFYFREKFVALQLSTFATQSATSGLMRCSKSQHFVQPLKRSLLEPGDGVTIVPRAEAFGGTVRDLAQPIPCTAIIIDPSES